VELIRLYLWFGLASCNNNESYCEKEERGELFDPRRREKCHKKWTTIKCMLNNAERKFD